MVLGYRVGYFLHQHGLAGSRSGIYEHPLSLTERGYQVKNPGRKFVSLCFEGYPLCGVQRGQVVKEGAFAYIFQVLAVDGFDLQKGKKPFLVLGRADISRDSIAFSKREFFDL